MSPRITIAAMLLPLLSACSRQPDAPSLTFHIYVDGSDTIKVTANKLWIEHEKFSRPAKQILVNSLPWTPQWTDNTSASFEDLNPSFAPADPTKIRVTKDNGRGVVSITQLPSPENKQTLAFKIDDSDFNGAAWYDITVTW